MGEDLVEAVLPAEMAKQGFKSPLPNYYYGNAGIKVGSLAEESPGY